jgi:hypothetical protein
MIYSFARNTFGSKVTLTTAVVYLDADAFSNFFCFWGVFSIPNFDWERVLSLPKCYFYSKLKGDAIYTSTCLLDLTQCRVTENSLDPVFTTFNYVRTFFADVVLSSPVPAIRLLSLHFLWIYLILRHIMSMRTINMHEETIDCYSLIFIILTGLVCIVITQ